MRKAGIQTEQAELDSLSLPELELGQLWMLEVEVVERQAAAQVWASVEVAAVVSSWPQSLEAVPAPLVRPVRRATALAQP